MEKTRTLKTVGCGTRGKADRWQELIILRTWGAAVLHPYAELCGGSCRLVRVGGVPGHCGGMKWLIGICGSLCASWSGRVN
jgi:hypothetical protein